MNAFWVLIPDLGHEFPDDGKIVEAWDAAAAAENLAEEKFDALDYSMHFDVKVFEVDSARRPIASTEKTFAIEVETVPAFHAALKP